MKKFRLFATILVVALCTTTVLTSCGNSSRIVGTWVSEPVPHWIQDDYWIIEITYHANGQFAQQTINSGGGLVHRGDGTFALHRNSMTKTFDGFPPHKLSIRFIGRNTFIQTNERGEETTFRRRN